MSESKNVEVGSRTRPVIDDLDTKFTEGRKSILIDKRIYSGGKSKIHNNLKADSQALPLSSNAADLFVSKDVFCSQGFMTYDSQGYIVTEKVGDFRLTAKEWFRVAKPGGIAIIIETLTPYEGLSNKLDNAFHDAGFVRKPEELLEHGEIAKLFKENSPLNNPSSYDTPGTNMFALVYHKP